MKNVGVGHYITIGLLAWGIPGVFFAGVSAAALTLIAVLPVWIWSRPSASFVEEHRQRHIRVGTLLVLALTYLVVDAAFGRQKFLSNLFLSADAAGNVIESANEMASQGRGLIELVGALTIFVPFALFDTMRRVPRYWRLPVFVVGSLFVFYDVGISRGYLLMAVLAIAVGTAKRIRSLVWASALALAAFVAASLARGDFDDVAFSNPLFDAIVFPFINLALMLDADCGYRGTFDFGSEFVKKFLPAFIVSKDVFSFNIEITRCIYPALTDVVDSISIFTWLGEMYYYQPGYLTALLAGGILAILARAVDKRLAQLGLWSTRIFVGMLCIVLLRSRVQDVFSFLVFLWLFLLVWQQFRYWPGGHLKPVDTNLLPPKSRNAAETLR